MPKDADGTDWATVTFTIKVDVMASTDWEATYFARLALPDYSPDDFEVLTVEV